MSWLCRHIGAGAIEGDCASAVEATKAVAAAARMASVFMIQFLPASRPTLQTRRRGALFPSALYHNAQWGCSSSCRGGVSGGGGSSVLVSGGLPSSSLPPPSTGRLAPSPFAIATGSWVGRTSVEVVSSQCSILSGGVVTLSGHPAFPPPLW